ncbi:alpha-ribazole phosphatase [Psychromonas marina]|uniref:Alpha-ribazole phosphatase n=1 Tax=Psychromonas marina TaxID=88364 RepID=A0ABQ6DY24_9GAMM|nr:alpha-ribazole phosphatase family protein [Psychromonas marina]GLS89641.1 alpha-ribazole phosphatase [Psychromonas marina]
MNTQLNIYLIRHTKPLIATGTCYGQLDCPVSDDYEQQLAKISGCFKDKKITAIYSSPLQRCSLLAEDLAKVHLNKGATLLQSNHAQASYVQSTHKQSVIYDKRFKEINFGDWEGEKWNDIARIKIDEWNENRLYFEFPNGETPAHFHDRVLQAWSELITTNFLTQNPINILLVAHSGVICSTLSRYLELSLENVTELTVDYASISQITLKNNKLKQVFVNQKSI